MKKYSEYKDLSLNEASVPPPHILHTLLIIQNGIKLAHWQTRSFPQHKALDDAHTAIALSADKLAESYIGKYGDQGRYLHYDMSIGLTNFKTQEDVEIFIQVCLASINMCAMMCLKKDDTELLNIVDEIRAELEKLKYLFTLKESIVPIEEATNDPNSFEVMIQQVMKIASRDFFEDLMDRLLGYHNVTIIDEYGKKQYETKSLQNIRNYWIEFKYKGEKFKMQFSNSGYSVYCDPGVDTMSTSLDIMFKKIDKYLKEKTSKDDFT